MGDTVRIYWTAGDSYAAPGETVYTCYVEGRGFNLGIFHSRDREEFFARYNALTVTKEPAPQEGENHGDTGRV